MMKIELWAKKCEVALFKNRLLVLGLFLFLTVFLTWQAKNTQLDASFTKNIPLNHSYMKTYVKHMQNFGGANSALISLCDVQGNIFNEPFFQTLKQAHDQLFFIPGIERTQVKSIFSPSTRFVEVVEDGFSGGPVIPANFNFTRADLAIVKQNIDKAGLVGRLVSNNYSCAMLNASIMDFDPATNEPLDTIGLAKTLEKEIREQYQSASISVHIIGFTKMVGDVAEGALGVLLFFAIAIVITTLMVFWFIKSIKLTFLPILCSLIAVIWQLGWLTTLGYGLDPMSILVPFLVFAIGVSHGVQMINSIKKRILNGSTEEEAARFSFKLLLLPGIVALLSDSVGFLTLLAIDIGIIKELAIAASLGVAMIILTNLILLPVLLSYTKLSFSSNKINNSKTNANKYDVEKTTNINTPPPLFVVIAKCARPKNARIIVLFTLVVFIIAGYFSQQMQIGDIQAGAPALHQDSRYNQDVKKITDNFSVTVDYISVIVEAFPDACTYYEILSKMDKFQWRVKNVIGVDSAISLASVAKEINAGYSEGYSKWYVLPRNQQSIVQSIARIPTSSGLLNSDCSVMPIVFFLKDHKAETIERIIIEIKKQALAFSTEKIQFKLASGPVGVMAATNEAVKEAQIPMLVYVYAAVIILCYLSSNCIYATASVVLPLVFVSVLAQWLMTLLDIGLTVSTLPVIALGVGIGVDYGIYLISAMALHLREGKNVEKAYLLALQERGSAVLFTGLTLAIGVSTWFFSSLKFQVDMGILLTFMFLVNMLAALFILPALSYYCCRNKYNCH